MERNRGRWRDSRQPPEQVPLGSITSLGAEWKPGSLFIVC